MKICLISNLYRPYTRGGAERMVEIIAEELIKTDNQVFLITANPFNLRAIFKPEIKHEFGIKIYRFYPLNLFFYINDWRYPRSIRFFWHFFDVYNWQSYFLVKRILKKERPDVVMTHNLKGIGYLIPWAIKKLKIKHLHTLHDVQLATPSGLIIKGQEKNWRELSQLNRLYIKINKKLFSGVGVIISPSCWLLDFHNRLNFFPKAKKEVLLNPIKKVINQRALPKRGKNNFNFLYLGQIEDHKGVLFLIKVFQNFCSLTNNKNVMFYIVGKGTKLARAKNLANQNPQIIFSGEVPRRELSKIFSKIDFTIVPSFCYENSPTVIYESFSFGVPVIASDIGGVGELVEVGKNGFIFAPGDEEDLLRLMRYVVENKTKVTRMKKNTYQAVSGFSSDKYVEKLLNLIESI
jgi:glycosyltransferase involved in cell wall biosynthesis